MAKLKLQGKDLRKIGYPEDKVIGIAIDVMQKNYKHSTSEEALELLSNILANPEEYINDAVLNKIADCLVEKPESENEIALKPTQESYAAFGPENIEIGATNQMDIAVRLPVAIAGALMPDAHLGYGLPIGGVLATENAIIPYGVGVDIGCRMCLSIFDMPAAYVADNKASLIRLLNEKTLFGSGAAFRDPSEHKVLDRQEFHDIALLRNLQQKAKRQLGTSGSGNHFVEFGIVEIKEADKDLNVPAGEYIALLSHSGSRGLGATIANHYTKVAMNMCKLPKEAKHLAWLNLDTQEGMEYWLAMNLAGDYASACHHTIHKKIAGYFKTQPLAMVENHHNFAWKEILNGKEVIVHRKGATPANQGELGIIPGSMASPGFVVKGKGSVSAINSAAHGAGRKMSRTQAKNTLNHKMLQDLLDQKGVTLVGGGIDEAPQAYKDIQGVMNAQSDLVDIIATFHPKVVKMDAN